MDNKFKLCVFTTAISGEHTPTVLYQSARKAGLGNGAVTALEFALDLGVGLGASANLKGLDLAKTSKQLTFKYDAKMASTTQDTLSSGFAGNNSGIFT